ncbi:MAG TPA: ribonuclease [Allosphingosinicella sp.]|nr:ribonuclease [Allosphingosinicella sp.]
MAEWWVEEGIGETRAILIEAGRIAEAVIELPETLPAGTILPARLARILVPGRRGLLLLPDGGEAIVEPLPPGVTEGQTFPAEIVREPIPEAGRPKRALCRPGAESMREGPRLRARLPGARLHGNCGPDRFENAGWTELLEEAASGEITFSGGALRMSVTPAMTLFDVDGILPPAALAVAGAEAAARAIRRMGIGGSIGIDLPTLPGKAERQAAAAALDAALPQPFERTAVNGFGFLQVVRRRTRASLPELLQSDPAGAAARALLRQAEWARGTGERTLAAAPSVIARMESRPNWLDALARRIGAPVALRPEPGLAISAGHVHARQS